MCTNSSAGGIWYRYPLTLVLVSMCVVGLSGVAALAFQKPRPPRPDPILTPCYDSCGAVATSVPQGQSCPAGTHAPIMLQRGAVMEQASDVTLPGMSLAWAHSRTYNSRSGEGVNLSDYGFINGLKWHAGALDVMLVKNGSDIDLYVDAHSRRTFTGGTTAPKDFRATLVEEDDPDPNAGLREQYRLTMLDSGLVYLFYDIDDDETDAYKRGLLKEISNRYGLEKITFSYINNVTVRGRILSVTTSQGLGVTYTYFPNGTNAGRIQSLDVANRTGQVIKRVQYIYYSGFQGYSTDVGTDGDLLMVDVRERASADNLANSTDGDFSIRHTTQYRYYKSADSDGKAHLLKMVLEPDDVEKINSAGDTSVDDPAEILTKADTYDVSGAANPTIQEYAARSFKYYTADVDTSSVTTPWAANEDLESKYVEEIGRQAADADEADSGTGKYLVKSETIRAGCGGCGGSGGSGITHSYFYMDIAQSPAGADKVTRLVVEDTEDSAGAEVRRNVYGLNNDGILLRQALIEDPTQATLKVWCQSTTVEPSTSSDSYQQPLQQREPSAHRSVDTNVELAKFLNPTSGTNDADTLGDSSGLIHVYGYTNGYRTEEQIKNGEGGTPYYVSATDWGDGTSGHPPTWLRTATYTYPTQTTTKSAGNKTEYSYTFYDGSNTQLETITTTYPTVDSTTQNGSGTATVTKQYFDTAGRLRWEINGEGKVTYYAQHPYTGAVAYSMVDVKTDDDDLPPADITSGSTGKWIDWPGSVPSGFTNTDNNALQLVSKSEYDDQGRLTMTTDAEGKIGYTVYKDNETRVYRAWNATTHKPTTPVEVIKTDDGGRVTEQFSVDPSGVSFSDPPTGSETLSQSAYATWTKQTYNSKDQLESVDRYQDIPSSGSGTLTTNYHRTFFKYDNQGRRTHTIEVVSGTASNSSVEQVTKSVYDVQGRVIEIDRGVSGTSQDMGSDYSTDPTLKQVSATFYDQATPGTGNAAVGDGNVTSTISYYDAVTPSNNLKTIFHHNWRNQLRGIDPQAAPFTVQDVDFMGRVVATAQFTTAPTWSTVIGDEDYAENASDANRRSLSTTLYDKMERVYQTALYAVVASGGSAGTKGSKIVSDRYYDRRSLLVAAVSSGKGAMEYAYDGAGRQYQTRQVTELEKTYTSGAFDYRDPLPATGIHADGRLNKGGSGGGNDKVLQIEHQELDKVGNVTQRITLLANHDDTNGLEVDATTKDYIQTAVYSWYDAAHRLTATANYGTGTSSWTYAALTARPGSAPSSSDTVLVSSYSYDNNGRLQEVSDPKGLVTRTVYDDLGRRVYLVENYANFDSSNEHYTGDASDKSKDRVTKYVYNGLSQLTQLVALDENADGDTADNQTTKYLYEDGYNAALPTSIIYPDSSDTDSTGTDQVKLSYNLDGTAATRTAQKSGADTATVITYTYDSTFHRQTIQGVSTVGTGIDSSIRSIQQSYDTMGRVEKITSFASSDGSGTASNEVQYAFDDLQALSIEYQEHSAAVTTATSLKVQYGYDTTAASSVFTKGYRPSSMSYPSTRVIYTLYDDAGDTSGIGDTISRVTALSTASTRGASDANVLAGYYYSGMSLMVQKDLPQPDVRLDYYQGTSGTYAGLDRFGRVKDHLWYDYDYGASADRERFKHGYDRDSNRLYRDHTITSTKDGFYSYDGLNRLSRFDQGDLNGTFSGIGTVNLTQAWTLKALGNWDSFQQDANGNGTFTDSGDLNQTRTHNGANEITDITETAGQVAWATPVQDAMGNITSYPKPSAPANSLSAKYDAWNRLVEVKDGANLVGSYVYDGLGRRITKKTYVSGNLDKTRQFFYTNQWQDIEERVDERSNDLERQYVWGIGYVDELIEQDRDTADDGTLDQRHYALQDANYNVSCLIDTAGDAQERYEYTPYGVRTIFDGSFSTTLNTSAYGLAFGHQGLMHDQESGMVYNRNRHLNTILGRFMSRDPMGYVDTNSLYEYVGNNPLSRLDAAGLIWPKLPGELAPAKPLPVKVLWPTLLVMMEQLFDEVGAWHDAWEHARTYRHGPTACASGESLVLVKQDRVQEYYVFEVGIWKLRFTDKGYTQNDTDEYYECKCCKYGTAKTGDTGWITTASPLPGRTMPGGIMIVQTLYKKTRSETWACSTQPPREEPPWPWYPPVPWGPQPVPIGPSPIR